MSKKLIYLASPYAHPDSAVREQRYEQVTQFAARLMAGGEFTVFSPISHSHPISQFISRAEIEKLGGDHSFWLEQDFAILDSCDELWLYCLDGWTESRGVQAEIEYCLQRKIPIKGIFALLRHTR